MTVRPFDLGLTEQDERAMRAARLTRFEVDREAALRLIADASSIVEAAVRRRPLPSGSPFTLAGHGDASDVHAAAPAGESMPPKGR